MRQCEHLNNGTRCKYLITVPDEEIKLCPLHSGVLQRTPDSPAEKAAKSEFDMHVEFCSNMNLDQIRDHILDIESKIEHFKIKLQAAHHVRNKKLRADFLSGALTAEQLEDIRRKRSSDNRENVVRAESKISKEEKEIQTMMRKFGMSREKAIKLLGME